MKEILLVLQLAFNEKVYCDPSPWKGATPLAGSVLLTLQGNHHIQIQGRAAFHGRCWQLA